MLKTSKRLQIAITFVANQSINVRQSELVQLIVVQDGADVADNMIVELLQAGDIVITQDIPLASRVVEKGGVAIGPRGELLDDKSVHGRLATRNLMEQFRSAGVETRGPKPFDKKDLQTFANTLDRTITRMKKRL